MCSLSPTALLHSVNSASFYFHLYLKWFISKLSDFYLRLSLVGKIGTAALCRPAVMWGHLLKRTNNLEFCGLNVRKRQCLGCLRPLQAISSHVKTFKEINKRLLPSYSIPHMEIYRTVKHIYQNLVQ